MHVHKGRCVVTSCLHRPAAAVCAQVSGWLWFVTQLLSSLHGLTSSGAHVPISIDSHPTLENNNKVIVCEVPSSATISAAPTTDGKQLPSVTMSKTYPDMPLVPIAKVGGAATLHHDDLTHPTSAGETECLPQCMSVCILYLHLLTSVGCLLGEGRRLTQLFLHIRYM